MHFSQNVHAWLRSKSLVKGQRRAKARRKSSPALQLELLEIRQVPTASVVAATGGQNISADKSFPSVDPMPVGHGSFTSLTNISITSNVATDFSPSNVVSGSPVPVTLIFDAPTNWQFNAPGSGTTTPFVSVNGNITDPTITTTTGKIFVSFVVGAASKFDAVTVGGIQVQSLNGHGTQAGPIQLDSTSTAQISGVFKKPGFIFTPTDFGDLSQSPGVETQLAFGTSFPLPFAQAGFPLTANGQTGGGPITVLIEDQFGNQTADNTMVSIAIGTNSSGGTLTGGGPVAASGGVATFSSLVFSRGGTYSLNAFTTGSPSLSPASTGDFSVAGANLELVHFTPPVGAVSSFLFTANDILTFSDDNPHDSVADFTATVFLGDGNSVTLTSTSGSNGQIVTDATSGEFDINLSYTYPNPVQPSGPFKIVVHTDTDSSAVLSVASAVTVVPPAIIPLNFTPPTAGNATEGAAFHGTVLQFTDNIQPAPTVTDYTVTILLGDGHSVTLTSASSSNGQIVAESSTGPFDISLSYTYLEEILPPGATFTVKVKNVVDTATLTEVGTVFVADAPLFAGPLTPPTAATATAGTPFGPTTVFQFTDSDPNGTASDYHATVVLVDGGTTMVLTSPSNVQVTTGPTGTFDVNLSYTYQNEVDPTSTNFSVTVVDHFASTSASGTATAVGTETWTGVDSTDWSDPGNWISTIPKPRESRIRADRCYQCHHTAGSF